VIQIGIVFAIIAALGLSLQALTVRVATLQARSSDVLLVALVVNAAIFAPLPLVTSASSAITITGAAAFAIAGILETMVGRAFLFEGIKRVGASRAEPIKATTPLHATILSVLVLGESVTGPQFAGVLIIIAGVALVTWEGRTATTSSVDSVSWIGLALPLVAAVCFGLGPIFASIGFRQGGSLLVGLAVQSIAGLVAYSLYLALQDEIPPVKRLRDADFRWYVFAGLASAAFMVAYYVGLEVSTVGIIVPIMQTSPLVTILLSAMFLQEFERVTPKVVFAAATIVAGGVLVAVTG
jgi:drug/metabolite transporter (DMT)-like permease